MAPAVSKLQFEERRVDDVTVLVLSGEILLDDGDLAFHKKIHELLDNRQIKIVVDLAGVTHIDSSGIGMMVAKARTVRDKKGDIKLVRLTRRTQNLLSSLKLVMFFETFDDEESAVRRFSWGGRGGDRQT